MSAIRWTSLTPRAVSSLYRLRHRAVVFPITAFVASGYEHSIANMYFIPLGLLLKSEDPVLAEAGLDSAAIANLDVTHFLLANLLPVTAGNIVGGGLLVAAVYWFIYRRNTA